MPYDGDMLLWIALLAFAEVPLPSFEDHLSSQAERIAMARWRDGKHEEAYEVLHQFEADVGSTAGSSYLLGLLLNDSGKLAEAERAYRRSIELDESRVEAWYDLGELLLTRGAWEEAGRAFARSTELYPRGPESWRSPWRQAEVAAHLRDPVAFEEHLHVALERGFSFRFIVHMPYWAGFYADPVLRDTLRKLVTVYGSADVLEALTPSSQPSKTPPAHSL